MKKSYDSEEKLIPLGLVNCVHCVGHDIANRMLKTHRTALPEVISDDTLFEFFLNDFRWIQMWCGYHEHSISYEQ